MIGLTRFTATGCGGAGQRSTGIRVPSVCDASGVQSRRVRFKAPLVRFIFLALVFASSCSGSSSSIPAPSAPPASPSVTAPPAPVDPYGAKLNLGFEDLVDGEPALWASVVGGGTAWFDELRLEAVDIPPAKPSAIGGVVVDPTGKPAAGATVALMDTSAKVTAVVTTDTT